MGKKVIITNENPQRMQNRNRKRSQKTQSHRDAVQDVHICNKYNKNNYKCNSITKRKTKLGKLTEREREGGERRRDPVHM